MPRQTKSTKQKEFINLSVLNLGKLERTRADAEGVLRDEDGQAYNQAG